MVEERGYNSSEQSNMTLVCDTVIA